MPSRPRNPGTLVAAAVLLFVYGGLLTICNLVGGVASAFNDPNDPMKLQETLNDEVPGHRLVTLGAIVVGFLLGAGMIVAGVGVLNRKPVARKTALFLCVLDIILVLASSAFNAIFVYPVMNRLFADMADQAQFPAPMGQFMAIWMWVALVLSILFASVFCGIIIALLNAAKSRAAFAGRFDPDPLDRLRDYDDLDEDRDPDLPHR